MPPSKTEPARGAAADLTRWFSEEVHPHDASLRAYLRGAFPAVRDVEDVVQESYLRIWRTRAAQPVRSARAFLFRIARNLALDLVRRDRVAPFSPVRDLEGLSVLDHGSSPDRVLDTQEKLMFLADAIEALPARCREVVILRKIQGLSQREVAARLGLAEKTVEAQLARGISRCEDYLCQRGVRSCYDHE